MTSAEAQGNSGSTGLPVGLELPLPLSTHLLGTKPGQVCTTTGKGFLEKKISDYEGLGNTTSKSRQPRI